MIELRDYQHRAVEGVRAAFRGGARSVCLVMPTGSGKTATASHCIRSSVELGYRVVFAAHLDALIDDTSQRLAAAGIVHGIVQASRPTNPDAPVQVASLQTLAVRDALPPADLVILDECHRACATTVRTILGRYASADLLGLTATPQRGDGQMLGDIFEALVLGPTMKELRAAGHVVPAHVFSPPAPIEGKLADDPVDALNRIAPMRPSMVFARDAAHAYEVAARLGSRAVVILGDTPRATRRQARERLAAGEPLVLVGCGVFLEGWDSPAVEVIVLARNFSVCGPYLQACGRGLRPFPGKSSAIIIDLVGAAILHGLPEDDRTWSLTAPPKRAGDDLRIELRRCSECFAVFHAGPKTCPRCGAATKGGKVARRATRIERQELARLDTRPLYVRDRIALGAIERALRMRGRCKTEGQLRWAVANVFRKKFGREPERGAA